MSEEGSDQDCPSELNKVKGPRKGRRWSLDTISPILAPWKRSISAHEEGSLPVNVAPRLAHTVPHITVKEESKGSGFPFPWRRGRRSSEMDAYTLGLANHSHGPPKTKEDAHGSGFLLPWRRGRRSSEMDAYTALNHMNGHLPAKGNSHGSGFLFPWQQPRRASDEDVYSVHNQNEDIKKFKEDVQGGATPLPWRRTRKTSLKEVYAVFEETDGDTFVVTGENEAELKTLVGAATMEERVSSYRVIVASTKQFLRLDSVPTRTRSFDNLLQHLQAVAEHSSQIDERQRIVIEMFESEQRYFASLQSLFDSYAEPLRKFSSLSKEDHRVLFMGVEPIFSLSASLVKKLEQAVDTWDTDSTKIGNLFSSKFWKFYREYYHTFLTAKQFLDLSTDKAFEDFCNLKQQQGVLSPLALVLLPIKRITEYDKYLNDLLKETDSSHPDHEDLTKAVNKVKNMVKGREKEVREAENDQAMETIQERFPYDDLNLKSEKEKAQKSRGLSVRRRSAPSAVVFKTLTGNRSRSSSSLWSQAGNMGRKDGDTFQAIKNAAEACRLYIMEGPVQFAMGMQTQDRYLFLFSDLLLVAKQKSSTTFKLKFRVHLCDVWLANCVDEVSETTRPLDKSFVIGWPTCNVVATFRDAETKEKWMAKLTEHVHEEKLRADTKEIPLKVTVRDIGKPTTCTLRVGNMMQAREVLQVCLQQLDIKDNEAKENYKLWVWSGKEGSVYPLIGHEIPFSIKVSHLREIARNQGDENMTLSELSSDEPPNLKCEFILRQKKTPKKHSLEEHSHKSIKKAKRSPLLNIFKWGGLREDKANNNTPSPQGKLFGHPLDSVCDSDNTPPKAIVDLLLILFREGPATVGILRKSPNARHCRELRERLDQGETIELNDFQAQAHVVGSVFKEYLRSLPDPLLCECLFDEWAKLPQLEDENEKMASFREILEKLPVVNLQLLKRVICVLHHIQSRADDNKMNSRNLSLCITPSMLWQKDNPNLACAAPAVEYMVDHCTQLFGDDVLMLLGEPLEFKTRQDSGTDSDSMHSVLSMQETGNGLRRDDSSIDSLVERELYTDREGGESSPKLVKSHLSPSNLSRDSGLTLSDTQLYDDDDHHSDHHRSRGGYHRSNTHHYDDYEYGKYSYEVPVIPVPPPRKRGKRHGGRGEDGEHASRIDTGGGVVGLRGRDKRHTLHGSVSTSQLLDQFPQHGKREVLAYSMDSESFRPVLSHPSFSKRVSSESLGKESGEHPVDRDELREYARKTMDEGLLRKSASGAHLYLDDELLPRKFSENSVPRQSSGVDSTPPLSPQSKYSYSSRDSVISDSSYGAGSRENSVNSAPQTPDDDHMDRMPPWVQEADESPRPSTAPQRFAMSLNIPPHPSLMMPQGSSAFSARYSASHLRSVQNVRYLVSPPASPVRELESQPFQQYQSRQEHAFQAPPPSPWPGKSREAEDVALSCSPQIHITGCSSSSDEKLDESGPSDDYTPSTSPSRSESNSPSRSFPLEIPQAHGVSLSAKQICKYSQNNISKGSPPPRVLLQNLRSPRSGKDPAPVRASHDNDILAQIQRGGKAAEPQEVPVSKGFDVARSMESINADEYISVKPKLTIIRREESIHSNTSSHSSHSTASSGSLGKESISTISSSHSSQSSTSSSSSSTSTVSGQSRPTKPPCYQEALQRNFMLQHDIPVDITESQRQASERAKILYEESLQKYLQDRYEQKHKSPVSPRPARKISDPGTSRVSESRGVDVGHTRLSDLRFDPHNSLLVSGPQHTASDDDVYVTLARDQRQNARKPREIYLESLQRYEQQMGAASHSDNSEHSGAAVKSPRSGDVIIETIVRHRSSEVSLEKRTQNPRPKSLLEISVSSNLQRSNSDSAEHIDKVGQCSSRSRSTELIDRYTDSRGPGAVQHRDASESSAFRGRKISDITAYERRDCSDSNPARHHFPTIAASYFYHPDHSPRSVASENVSGKSTPVSRSPRSCSPRPDADAGRSRGDTSSSRAATKVESSGLTATRSAAISVNVGVSGTAGGGIESGASVGSGSDVAPGAASGQASTVSNAPSTRGKANKDLPWSVKSLKQIYDSENKPGQPASVTVTAAASAATHSNSLRPSESSVRAASTGGAPSSSGRPALPPYLDPPPFRRLQDNNRMSTSSNSSNGSSNSTERAAPPSSKLSSSTSPPRRLGPQSASLDYCSSCEDLRCYSSRWSRARSESGSGSGSGLSDQELTNSYTDISYV